MEFIPKEERKITEVIFELDSSVLKFQKLEDRAKINTFRTLLLIIIFKLNLAIYEIIGRECLFLLQLSREISWFFSKVSQN